MEEILHLTRQGLVGQRHDAGGGLPFGHLPGQIGPGQDAGRATRQDLRHHFGHPEIGAVLNALGQADDRLDLRSERSQLRQHSAEPV